MNSEQRADLLKNCVAQLVATHSEFVASRDEEIDPKHPFWKASDALIGAFDDEGGDIPASCRRIFAAVWGNGEADQSGTQKGFKAAWNRWKAKEETRQAPTWKPSADVWAAYRNLKEQMRVQVTQPLRLVETVAELVSQGVTDQQIAYIYNRRTQMGTPDLAWVARMKANPQENTEETRMVYKARVQSSEKQWAEYAASLAANRRVARTREMLEQGIDPEGGDIGHRFSAPTGPQLAFSDEYDSIPQPDWSGASRDEYEAPAADYGDEPINVEQRAVMMLDEGVDDAEITSQLGISGQKLGAIKRRASDIRESMPQAAGV